MHTPCAKCPLNGGCCVMNSAVKTRNTIPIYLSVMWSHSEFSFPLPLFFSLTRTHAHILLIAKCATKETAIPANNINAYKHIIYLYPHSIRYEDTHKSDRQAWKCMFYNFLYTWNADGLCFGSYGFFLSLFLCLSSQYHNHTCLTAW